MNFGISTTVALLFALGLLTLAGCKSNPHNSRIDTADSLQTVVQELQIVFDSVDYDHHFKNRSEMMADIERVERYFKTQNDTMPRDLAFALSDYRLAWKGYKRMEGEYNRIQEALVYSADQMRTLKTDLENNAVNEKMADRFLSEEVQAIGELDINTRAFAEKMRRTEMKYKAKKPVIVQMADSLENSVE